MHNSDYWGHVEYIDYIKNKHTIPPSTLGWQTYQPPLYYVFAAVSEWVGNIYLGRDYAGPRYLSAFLMLVFQFFGLLIIRDALKDRRIQMLCSATFLFWPLFLALVARISNDVMLYALWAASLYYLFRWHEKGKLRDLNIAWVLCGAMFLVKASAVVHAALICTLILYHTFRYKLSWKAFMTLSKYGFLALLCALLVFGRAAYYKLTAEPELGLLMGNLYQDALLRQLTIPNSFQNFRLNINTLLTQPYFNMWNDYTGRRFFWNSYFKTALFGHTDWPYPGIALKLNLLLIAAAFFCLIAVCITSFHANIFFIIGIAVCIASQIASWQVYSTAMSQDARYTLPVLILFITLLGRQASDLLAKKTWVLGVLATALLAALAWFGLCFMAAYSSIG